MPLGNLASDADATADLALLQPHVDELLAQLGLEAHSVSGDLVRETCARGARRRWCRRGRARQWLMRDRAHFGRGGGRLRCRYGGSELHSVAAVMGGVASQEVLKLLTHQFVPLNHTFVFNGVHGASQTFAL